MILDKEKYRQYLENSIKNDNLIYEKKLEIFEEMFILSKDLGLLNKIDPLEGTEKNIRIAGILNRCLKNNSSD
ncbi:hypothetical protein JXL83_07115 [candidate division WOR-3 bacterium]|nr:hypothetical protein [candidate division WOR-3 bacterium]